MSAPPTLFAGEGEPCTSCGAPLAADQRYCLTCGHRRAAARLPFLEILRGEETHLMPLPGVVTAPAVGPSSPVGGAVPPVADDTLLGRARANTGLIAGVGVLLLAMLIGVLVGSGLGHDSGSALADQKPVVVSVGAGAAAPAAAAATPTDTGAAAAPATTKPKTSSRKSASGASSSKATITPKKVAPAALQNLDKLSGKAYQKQVDKLGKNIATGGKAPPKDNKPAAGGGSFQDIG